jgi:outer membrane lipoprotein-sorting protein
MALFRTYKIILVFFLLLLLSAAAADNIDDIYEAILEKYSSISTYEADFTQENYWKDLDVDKISSGKVYYNSNCFLLSYTEPAGQTLLLEDNILKIVDIESNQMLITDNITHELRPDKIISSYWQNSQVDLVKRAEDLIELDFITQSGDSIFVVLNDFMIREFCFTDKQGNSVKYSFSKSVINPDLTDSVFELDLPQDIDIIDNRSSSEK